MKRARPLLVVAVVGLVLLPSSASADGRRQRSGVVVVAPRGSVVIASPSPVVVRPGPRIFVAPTPSAVATMVPRQHFFHRFGTPAIVTRPFFPVVAFAPSVIVSAPPVVYAQPPVVYSQPPPVVSVAPAPLATPTVIEYPTGWYQLRGDGVTTPYVWVWIPKPPPPPPSEAPPALPPDPASTAPADPPTVPPGQPRSSASPGEFYRWTDEQGGAHWTDRPDNIPERYRSKAQRWS